MPQIEGGAVHGNKGLVLLLGGVVDHPGNEFLTAAGVAHDEHGGLVAREQSDGLEDGIYLGGVADDAAASSIAPQQMQTSDAAKRKAD